MPEHPTPEPTYDGGTPEDTYSRAHAIAKHAVAEYVETGYRTAIAGTTDPVALQQLHQLRHLGLGEPHLPASKIADALQAAGLLATGGE